MVVTVGIPRTDAGFAVGTGQPDAPYQIATAEQLISIGSDPNLLNKHFVLIADIDLDPNLPGRRVFNQAVIAPATGDPRNPQRLFFTGTFEGKNHTIKNLTIHADGGEWLGLFGEIGEGGRVCNLTLDGVHITGASRAGALAGWNTGTVDHCASTGSIFGDWMAGGLVGQNGGGIDHSHSTVYIQGDDESFALGGLVGTQMEGAIVDCHASGKVSASKEGHAVGGLVGSLDAVEATIANCWASGNISSGQESEGVGGLVGSVMMGGIIKECYATGHILCGDRSRDAGGLIGFFSGQAVTNCYAAGNVTGGASTSSLGGLVGSASPMRGTITNCYAVGKLSREKVEQGLGGLIGETPDPDFIAVTNCFWDIETTGVSTGVAGKGLTTSQMQTIQTYQGAGWDLAGDRSDGTADIWLMPPGGRYPQLTVFSSGYQPRRLTGAGTPQNPFLVGTAEDLSAITEQKPSACYSLTADIDLSAITWRKACIPEFTGAFNGKGHRIRHLTIRSSEPGDVGFFGNMRGHVWNLALEDVSIAAADGARGVGGLAGSSSGYITNCYVTGSVSAGSKSLFVGGLVGDARLGIITDCYTVANVSAGDGGRLVGGLVGYNSGSTITHCYAGGTTSAGQGSKDIGGLTGGGGDSVTHCFWASETGPLSESDGGGGLTTSQMQSARTFQDAGWDFVGETRNGPADTWRMPGNGGYPVLSVFSRSDQPHNWIGAGTPDDPYQVVTARDLGTISRHNPLACYKLTADLDLSGVVWTAAPVLDFNGMFDGAGHTISNLAVRSASFTALFGNLGTRAVVKNLLIRDANIAGDDKAWCVGTLAGKSEGTISACHVTGRVSAGRESRAIGGIVGEIISGTVTSCDAASRISVGQRSHQVGGITGFSLEGKILACRATGPISGAEEDSSIGGLLGEAHFWTVVSDCYAIGTVSGGRRAAGIGGLVGIVSEGDLFPTPGRITNCYAASEIAAGDGSTEVGGLLGKDGKIQPLLKNCYFLAASADSGLSNGNGTPLSDEQMKRQASLAGWDFASTWTILEGKSYPRLRWERVTGEQ